MNDQFGCFHHTKLRWVWDRIEYPGPVDAGGICFACSLDRGTCSIPIPPRTLYLAANQRLTNRSIDPLSNWDCFVQPWVTVVAFKSDHIQHARINERMLGQSTLGLIWRGVYRSRQVQKAQRLTCVVPFTVLVPLRLGHQPSGGHHKVHIQLLTIHTHLSQVPQCGTVQFVLRLTGKSVDFGLVGRLRGQSQGIRTRKNG